MVHGKHPRQPVGGPPVQRRDQRRVADYRVGRLPGQQPAGQVAHLRELGQVSPLQDEVGSRHHRSDPLARRLEALVTAADEGDCQPLPGQPAGYRLPDAVGRARHYGVHNCSSG